MKQGYNYSQGLGMDRNRFKTLSTGTWVMGSSLALHVVWFRCRTVGLT
jgi:hypothetical protein